MAKLSTADQRGTSHGLLHIARSNVAKLAKLSHPADSTSSIGMETRRAIPSTSPATLATALPQMT